MTRPVSSEPLTVDRAAVKAVASWVVDDDDFDEAMAALEDALHARYRTKTVADLSDAVAARSATPSSEEPGPAMAQRLSVPRLGTANNAMLPLATPDNAGRSPIDVEGGEQPR